MPVGSVLDNDLDPGSRFDSPDNGQFTSPMAEVCYFLRADRPYELAEINRPALGTDDGRLARAATYTLYRRELLVLSESQRTRVEERLLALTSPPTGSVIGDMTRPTVVNANASLQSGNTTLFNPSVYQHYDVAVRYDFLNNRLRFNDVLSLRLRQNRYGMTTVAPSPLPAVAPPQFFAPFYDFDVPLSGASAIDLVMHTPNRTLPASASRLFRGRPTLLESTLIGSEGFADVNYAPNNAAVRASLSFSDPSLGFDNPQAAPRPVSARRGNADVLLTNVLSFDVKVLNDDILQGPLAMPILSDVSTGSAGLGSFSPDFMGNGLPPTMPTDRRSWPAVRTTLIERLNPLDPPLRANPGLPASYSNFVRLGTMPGNASRLRAPYATPIDPLIQTDFIDLGYSLVREYPAVLNPGLSAYEMARPRLSAAALTAQFGVPLGEIPWGSQTPARWASLGRREAWFWPTIASVGPIVSTVSTPTSLGCVFDTWAPEYNAERFSEDYIAASPGVQKYLPPYDRPLRGIQITIRTLEPRSGLVREFQIVHRF